MGHRRRFAVLSCALVMSACSLVIDLSSLETTGDGSAPNDAQTNDIVTQSDSSDGASEGGDAQTGPCAITCVQAVPGTSLNHVMAQSSTAKGTLVESGGDLLVAIAYGGQNPNQTTPPTTAPNMTFAISDTVGNTYYAAPMIENSRSNQAAMQIFFAPNVKAGANVVTVTSASPSPITLWTGLLLQEYSGVATTNVVDISSAQMAPSASTAIFPPTITTTTSCALVVGGFADGHVQGQSLSPFAGWVMRSTDEWDPSAGFDDAPTPLTQSGQQVAGGINLSIAADDGWVAEQLAFRGQYTTSPAQPSTLVFTTPSRTVIAGACSAAVTIESRASGAATTTSTGITMTLSAQSTTFYVDPACAFPISSLFIGAGTSSSTFYFKGAKGSPSISATANGFSPAIQTETIN